MNLRGRYLTAATLLCVSLTTYLSFHNFEKSSRNDKLLNYLSAIGLKSFHYGFTETFYTNNGYPLKIPGQYYTPNEIGIIAYAAIGSLICLLIYKRFRLRSESEPADYSGSD